MTDMQMTLDQTLEIREATRRLAGLGGRRLLHLALDAVQTLDETELRAAAPGLAPYRPQMLLTLLTWCYASGTYSSRDIVWAMRRDPTVRYLCAGTRPDWPTLRRFRRAHRLWLEQCLAWVLKQAWALKLEDGEATFHGLDWFENRLAVDAAAEARTRLDLAALMDAAESEL